MTGSDPEPASGIDTDGGADSNTDSVGDRRSDAGDGTQSSGLSRTILIAIGLAVAVGPFFSVADAIAVTTGYENAPAWLRLAILTCAGLLGYWTELSLDSVGLFTAVTLLCWVVIDWTLLADQRLEYAPTVLLSETLALLAAVLVGITVAFGDQLSTSRTDGERRSSGDRLTIEDD